LEVFNEAQRAGAVDGNTPHESRDANQEAAFSAERQAHARLSAEWLKLTFRGFDHLAANWSPGGVLIEDRHADLQVGGRISGFVMLGTNPCRYRFTADIVRREGGERRKLALCFVDPSPALRHALLYPTQ
jgi:hypothetical protein